MATTTRFGLDEFHTPDYARLMPGHDPNAALMPRLWQALQAGQMFKNLFSGDGNSGEDESDYEKPEISMDESQKMEGYIPQYVSGRHKDQIAEEEETDKATEQVKDYTPDDDSKKESGYAKRMAEYASGSWDQLRGDTDDDQFANFDPMTATPDEIREVQEAIGLTDKDVDGIWGRKSWAAFQDFKNKADK